MKFLNLPARTLTRRTGLIWSTDMELYTNPYSLFTKPRLLHIHYTFTTFKIESTISQVIHQSLPSLYLFCYHSCLSVRKHHNFIGHTLALFPLVAF